MIYNIMTCGVGGQGLMLVSNIIGLTCADLDYNIRTAETHGLAQRSGSIYTHIRISMDEEIFSSLIPYGEADVLLSMEALEALRNIEFLNKDGTIILNEYIWHPVQETFKRVKDVEKKYITLEDIVEKLKEITNNIINIPALDYATQAGNPLTSNVVLLGVLAKLKDFPLNIDDLKKNITLVVPEKAIKANLNALELGYNFI
ncbi:MAG: indolepyruvate oxidoreductase subunit beta [Candidatus Hermodarchaeota archaeon]